MARRGRGARWQSSRSGGCGESLHARKGATPIGRTARRRCRAWSVFRGRGSSLASGEMQMTQVLARSLSNRSARQAKLLLIVDDDQDLRESVRDVLEEAGYLVQTARHGGEALELLRSGGNAPDLILLDL